MKRIANGYFIFLKLCFTAFVMFFFNLNSKAQVPQDDSMQTIRGRIFNTKEPIQPIEGATVRVKSTGVGISTAPDGSFTIAARQSDILIITSVGYTSIEYPVANAKSSSNYAVISLEDEVVYLENTIVTGYATQKVKNMASSIGIVNMDNVRNKPITQLSQALQGGVTGIEVTQASGLPGGDAATLKIRGVATLGSSTPLVLLDGVPFDINKINPATVESITVLKDAAAASLYGARAANGVIIITTKRGRAGKLDVQYNGYYGTQIATKFPDFVDAPTYMRMVNDANRNASGGGAADIYTEEAIDITEAGTDPVNYPNTNWTDLVMRKSAPIQSHSLTVSGGNAAARFVLNADYLFQEGIVPKSNFGRGTLRANTSIDLTRTISVFMDMYAARDDQKQPYGSNFGYEDGAKGIVNALYYAPPNMVSQYPSKPDDPNLYFGYFNQGLNPYAMVQVGGRRQNISDEILFNLRPKWEIIAGLNVKGQFGYRVTSGVNKVDQEIFNFFDYSTGLLRNTDYVFALQKSSSTNRSSYYFLGSNFDYNKSFDRHNINVLGGYSQELTNSSAFTEVALRSLFAKVYYSYDSRYLVEAGARRDGSSLFGKGLKWGNFPSIALGWNVHNESFMQNAKFIDQLKLRASYGLLGNNNISPYTYQTTINGSNGAESTIGNPDITWEKVNILNLGIDLSIVKKKLDITFDYYDKLTNDLILTVSLPYSSGLASSPLNYGKMRNRGFETKVSYNETLSTNVSFSLNVGYSYNGNTIERLYVDSLPNGNMWYIEGQPFAVYYGLKSDGLLQEKDIADGVPMSGTQYAGDIKYMDLNRDGLINDADRTVLGNTGARSTYFANFTLRAYNFEFETMFSGRGYVPYFYSGVVANPLINTSLGINTPVKEQVDYWSPQNTGAAYPRILTSPGANSFFSDYWKTNGAFMRVRYMQVAYNFPARITGKMKIGDLRAYLNAQNPFTLTKVKIVDPESGGNQFTYPIMRIITFGINVTF
ncbi:TonB-dependent receptor [Agriterribacter sp.]|uniref:SusC/RagA family TonB-linked outer membrane protein n=1 Tax=Agriterribacter sp. TaxID=2821509 RepID=UPI002BDCAE62|nr:TonB-dependent receptor [Agriterribacter sp.]HRP56832.1 TonB-dependent receptor [Agriterribacter sp.]